MCLLLIGAEAVTQSVEPLCLTQFLRSGLVDAELAPGFNTLVASGAKLRDTLYLWGASAGW